MKQIKSYLNFVKHAVILSILLGVGLVILSCSIDTIQNQQNNASSLDSQDTNQKQDLEYLSKYNASKRTSSNKQIFVLLVNREVNEQNLAKELNATLLNSLIINEKKYIKVSGVAANSMALQAHPKVLSVEQDLIRQSFAIPNDTFYSMQYAPQLTDLESVWGNYTGKGVTVAVIDTGVNTVHEDFGGSSAFVEGWDYSTPNNGNEYTTTTHNDENGHGTHVAGIIGARKNNGMGIAGVAPEATIMPIRASSAGATTSFTSFNTGAAIKYAADNGADIINLSLGGIGTSGIEGDAISYALKKNVVIIAASGNDSTIIKNYPASYPGVISVASSNGRDEVSNYSTRSPFISVAAPGEEILSLEASTLATASNSYVDMSGTSMAAPYVSGLAALLKQNFPTATPAQIKEILESTAKDIDITGKDYASGHGRVDPVKALATTTLPDITWTEVEYTVSYASKKLSGRSINILDNSDILFTSAITDSNGIASFFLPKGTYKAISGYYGISKSESIILTDTKLSKTIEFQTSDFTNKNYYRVSTYYTTTSFYKVDTILSLWEDGTTPKLLLTHDDKSSSDYYSEIVFKATSGTKYLFKVSSNPYDPTGFYRIILESNLPTSLPTSTAGSTGDETKDDSTTREDLILTPDDNPRMGYLSSTDIDYFIFTAP